MTQKMKEKDSGKIELNEEQLEKVAGGSHKPWHVWSKEILDDQKKRNTASEETGLRE